MIMVTRHCHEGIKEMKYVLFYESASDVATKAPTHYSAHHARALEFHARGTLLLIGSFVNAQEEGAMGIFTTHKAAEEFAMGDPFVLNGVVRSWHVRAWNETLSES
jgi:uncharacterized protein